MRRPKLHQALDPTLECVHRGGVVEGCGDLRQRRRQG